MSTGGAPPTLTVVIPTKDRPHLLPEAIDSALGQTVGDLEVVVVDDGSTEPVVVPPDPRVRLVRLEANRGNAAARNAGLAAARGRWITCLDDDDVLVEHHAAVSLEALERSDLPPPVGVVSAVAAVDADGTVASTRVPPRRPRGCLYSLEPLEPGRSYNAKQSLVVETDVLRGIGGWDESLRSRVVTELFLRLNPVCSLEGLDTVTYHLRQHPGPRVSRDPALRQAGFAQLVATHRAAFESRPERYAELLLEHGLASLRIGQLGPGAVALADAVRRSPRVAWRRRPEVLHTLGRVVRGDVEGGGGPLRTRRR